MDRRAFLRVTAVAGTAFAGCGRRRLTATGRLERIGLQLYTVRELLARNLAGTLARVAEIGYREVEFAGYFGHPPAEVRRVLVQTGLEAPSGHVPLDQLRHDLAAALHAAAEIGHRYLVLAWLDPQERRSLDHYRRTADLLNRAGAEARSVGLRMGYHNHDFEFVRTEGQIPYDLLLDRTDPALVCLEADLYWMARGRASALSYFRRYPGRFELCHLKDMGLLGGITEVGSGRLDFGAVLAAREVAGLKHCYVEHDYPRDPLASAEASYRYLRDLRF